MDTIICRSCSRIIHLLSSFSWISSSFSKTTRESEKPSRYFCCLLLPTSTKIISLPWCQCLPLSCDSWVYLVGSIERPFLPTTLFFICPPSICQIIWHLHLLFKITFLSHTICSQFGQVLRALYFALRNCHLLRRCQKVHLHHLCLPLPQYCHLFIHNPSKSRDKSSSSSSRLPP